MAFRRGFRRRKPRVQWMPNPGTGIAFPVSNDPFGSWAGIQFNFVIPAGSPGNPQVLQAPLVVDNPVSETFEGSTLGVYQKGALNQTNDFGWRLRRIVGDLFVSYGWNGDTQAGLGLPGVLVEAGIIVRRVDGQTGDPIAGAEDQDPSTLANNRDPWVWRRNWILGSNDRGSNIAAIPGPLIYGNDIDAAIGRFPATNVQYGSAQTGARVDQKTNRRLGPEERLFLNMTVYGLPLEAGAVYDYTKTGLVLVYFPYRVLGTTFTAAGNRNNASR